MRRVLSAGRRYNVPDVKRCVTALLGGLAVALALAAPAGADVISGSPLTGEPTVEKSSTVDTVYWLQTLPDGSSAAMASGGTVQSVTIKGYAKSKEKLLQTILIQVLRPQPDGKLLVVETSQPFPMPTEPGTHVFVPTNMTVQAGDFIGIATLGGAFMFATEAKGAVTNDFSGHEKDMNGDEVSPTKVETNVELLAKVDLVSQYEKEKKEREEKEKKKEEEVKNKPCECQLIEVFIDKMLLQKRRVPSSRRTFGVGFDWHLTCTQGRGGCAEALKFSPPEILVGRHKRERFINLTLESFTFICKTACNTSTFGRFEIKMKSRRQLNKLFGKTLAFRIEATCGPFVFRYFVDVLVDQHGHLRAGPAKTLKVNARTPAHARRAALAGPRRP
jgi:hypothetical protein